MSIQDDYFKQYAKEAGYSDEDINSYLQTKTGLTPKPLKTTIPSWAAGDPFVSKVIQENNQRGLDVPDITPPSNENIPSTLSSPDPLYEVNKTIPQVGNPPTQSSIPAQAMSAPSSLYQPMVNRVSQETGQTYSPAPGATPGINPDTNPPPASLLAQPSIPPETLYKPQQNLTTGEAMNILQNTVLKPQQPIQPTLEQPTTTPEPIESMADRLKRVNSEMQNESPSPTLINAPAGEQKNISPSTAQVIDNTDYGDLVNSAGDLIPEGSRQNASRNIPLIIGALKNEGIDDPDTIAYTLATIGHETAGTYAPIEEINGRDQAQRLGYEGGPDYFGRGFIQLTGRGNYDSVGKRIGVPDLVNNPQKALDPQVSAKITAAFIKDRGVSDLAKKGDYIGARGPINGTDQADKIAQSAQQWKSIITKAPKQTQNRSVNKSPIPQPTPKKPSQAEKMVRSNPPKTTPTGKPIQNKSKQTVKGKKR